jgi:hypothetical protein
MTVLPRLAPILVVLPLLATGAARAAPTAEHAAACVAALQADAEQMARQFRDGHPEIEPALAHRVEQAFAFIGVAYKQGLAQPDADRLLKAAEKAQSELTRAELAARQAACASEGSELLKQASGLERALVTRAAQRRIDKLKRAG